MEKEKRCVRDVVDEKEGWMMMMMSPWVGQRNGEGWKSRKEGDRVNITRSHHGRYQKARGVSRQVHLP